MIQEAIFNRLSAFPGLTALIGAGAANCRAYYRLLPENPSYPAVRFFEVSTNRDSVMGVDTGLVHQRWQFDVLDTDQDSVRDTAKQVVLALQRWRTTDAGVTVQDTFIDNEQAPQDPELVDAVPVYRKMVDALIHYLE